MVATSEQQNTSHTLKALPFITYTMLLTWQMQLPTACTLLASKPSSHRALAQAVGIPMHTPGAVSFILVCCVCLHPPQPHLNITKAKPSLKTSSQAKPQASAHSGSPSQSYCFSWPLQLHLPSKEYIQVIVLCIAVTGGCLVLVC